MFTTIIEAFQASAARYPNRPFLRAPASSTASYSDGAIEYTYASARDYCQELKEHYTRLDLKVGDRVALAFDARLDVYLHFLALNAAGVSLVPLNMGGSDADILYVINHSDCRLVVTAKQHQRRLKEMLNEADSCAVLTVEELAEQPEFEKRSGDSITPDLQSEVALLYTSGTTGKPKGCMLSNEYFLIMGVWYNNLQGPCQIDQHDRLLTPLPPNHMNALCTSFMAMMMCGGCVIQLDRFHPGSWWRTVRDEYASIIHYLGVMPAMLLTFESSAEDNFGEQIKFGFGAGSDPRHQEVFETRFGFPLIEAWAMTESGAGGLSIADAEPRHVGQRCVGSPIPTMEYRLVDENDVDVTAGEPGELLVRSRGENPRRGFFSGYHRDEAATEEGWKDGWWHTGDVVRVGEDDMLFFVDRRKNVIRRSGENIAAVEVEAALLRLTEVDNSAVAPVPDEIRGDEVFAFVVVAEGIPETRGTVNAILDGCLDWLTYFKAPGYIAFTDALPLTGSQKVDRASVKKEALAAVEAGEVYDLRHLKKRVKKETM